MPTSYWIIISIFWSSCLLAQSHDFKRIYRLERTAEQIQVDKMKQLYLLENAYSLSKYSPTGDFLYRYNENNLGEISFVDVSNPLRVMVYYDDYTTLVLLDRTLSEVQRHDLSELDLAQVQALGLASDNNIWLFDNNTYTLKKIDAQNQVLAESVDLSLLLTENITPTLLLEKAARVYLNAPDAGILVFDIFGNYIKTIEITGLDAFQVYDEQLFYVQDQELYSYHLKTFFTQKIELPILEKNLKQVYVNQNIIYLHYKNYVDIIGLKKK